MTSAARAQKQLANAPIIFLSARGSEGERVFLTATELKLLSFLMSRPGRVCAQKNRIM